MAGLIRALLRPEYLRTCRACGYTWKVPKWYAKIHPSGMPRYMSPNSSNGYGRAFSTGRASNVVANNAALAEDVARYRTCAKCRHARQLFAAADLARVEGGLRGLGLTKSIPGHSGATGVNVSCPTKGGCPGKAESLGRSQQRTPESKGLRNPTRK